MLSKSRSEGLPSLVQRPERPDRLKALMEASDEMEEKELELFKTFLLAVEKAQRDMFAIQSTCTITMHHQLQSNRVGYGRIEQGNSSLRAIFYFYAKLQLSGNITFDDLDVSNITISFYELMAVMRDFGLIPTFISKEDVQFAWRVMNLQSVKLGDQIVTELDFDQFKEFLARCAVLMYNRTGMRRMILTSHGAMPSHEQLVQMLATTMKLDDYHYVKTKINTLGGSRVKNREKNVTDSNEEIKRELREDVNARRLARAMVSDDALEYKSAKKIAEAMHTKLTGLQESDLSIQGSKDSRVGEKSIKSVGLNAVAGSNVSEIQERELRNFDPATTLVLDKYCVNLAMQSVIQTNDGFRLTNGAFLDLGELIPGSICNVNLVIRNNSSQEIQLDVVARGFPSQDIHIVTLPNSFAPGLTRNVNVSFTVHKQIFDVLAFIDIVVVPVRTESSVTLSCPLYYRVCESTSSRRLTSFPVCSTRSIPELLRKYCGREISPVVDFEKTRNWYSGPGWKFGPVYDSEFIREQTRPRSRSKRPKSSGLIQFSPTQGLSGQSKTVTLPGCYRGIKTSSPQKFVSVNMEMSRPLMR